MSTAPRCRQEVVWVPLPETRTVRVSAKPSRVWTLTGKRAWTATPPELPMIPVHGQGAFLEDEVHDWKARRNDDGSYTLRYYSRLTEKGTWVLVEYDAP